MEKQSIANIRNDELHSIVSKGIPIWSTTQEDLENQALKELEIFVEEKNKNSFNEVIETTFPDVNIDNNDQAFNIEKQCRLNRKVKSISIENIYELTEKSDNSGSEYIPSEDDTHYEISIKKKLKNKHTNSKKQTQSSVHRSKLKDDAFNHQYEARLKSYYETVEIQSLSTGKLHEKDYKQLKNGLKVPYDLWNRLYDYQKDGVKWLWELHQKPSGGLLGDEMGLGKTVQIIVFLHALRFSNIESKHCNFLGVGPSLIVCPATVINQWLKHFHEWSPEFRVAILHQSGSYQDRKSKLIDIINRDKGIILTTYPSILKYQLELCKYNWHYVILDEGHKIRNPSAKITIAIKQIRTPHSLMLTGSPMQNNLTELWSLFDFTNPGMLGNLATFTEHFATPIIEGGFANANPMQEATALSIASTLKNIISPFLLRRLKKDVKDIINLPEKSEQVLFCSLTVRQKELYKNYLIGDEVNNILKTGMKTFATNNRIKGNIFIAIMSLRKICNHPDLFSINEEESEDQPHNEEDYGNYKDSGKMVVVAALLKIWKKNGHRTLLFSQGRSMIRIFEKFLKRNNYHYLKMDGSTTISSRQTMIDTFNNDKTYSVFLLTTRVGGLGVNLTGADRVIIYDPDWNPATDTQARERAWRIGQEKSVTVYRLITAGTVEEKMYQRQVWKQLLSNKILIDPATNKFLKSSDLFDLFSLPDDQMSTNRPETTNIFRNSRIKVQEKLAKKKKSLSTKEEKKIEFSQDKIEQMKNLAQQIARSLSSMKTVVEKTPDQIQLEKEREQKLCERENLKIMSPVELLHYNRTKDQPLKENEKNCVNDQITNITFDKALDEPWQKSQEEPTTTTQDTEPIPEQSTQIAKRKRKHSNSHRVPDTTGIIDGENIEGLIKRERSSKRSNRTSETIINATDNYILKHLFAKKGVSGVLEHESVLNSGKKPQSLKVRTDAEMKALKSLEALKKSRLNNWRW